MRFRGITLVWDPSGPCKSIEFPIESPFNVLNHSSCRLCGNFRRIPKGWLSGPSNSVQKGLNKSIFNFPTSYNTVFPLSCTQRQVIPCVWQWYSLVSSYYQMWNATQKVTNPNHWWWPRTVNLNEEIIEFNASSWSLEVTVISCWVSQTTPARWTLTCTTSSSVSKALPTLLNQFINGRAATIMERTVLGVDY